MTFMLIFIYIFFIHSKYDIYNYLRAIHSQNHAKNSLTFISTCNVYKGLQVPITTGLLEAFWGIAAGRGQFLQKDEICAFVSGADLLWSFSSSLWICQDSRSNFETPSPGAVTASKHALHIRQHISHKHIRRCRRPHRPEIRHRRMSPPLIGSWKW